MNSFLVGLQFLTRIHLSSKAIWKDEEFGKSVMWFPVIGWIIGLFSCSDFSDYEAFGYPLINGIPPGDWRNFYFRRYADRRAYGRI